MRNYYKILLIASLLARNTLLAQQNNYVFRHIDQHDGLAHNNVLDITQDRRGFIWLITRNGLQRYDGSRFINYSDNFNIYVEPNNDANIYADSNNTIWIPKVANLQKLEPSKNIFTSYQPEEVLKDTQVKPETFTGAHDKKIILAKQGCFFYDTIKKKYTWATLRLHPFTQNETDFFATDNSTGNVWSLAEDGLILYDRQTKKMYSGSYNPMHNFLLDAFKKILKPGDGRNLMMDSHNNLWVTTWGGLFYKYDINKKKINTYSLGEINNQEKGKKDVFIKSPATVSCLFEDDHGIIWVSTDYDGLLKYDAAKNSFENIYLGAKNNNTLFNYQVFCIFQDKDENIWLGTDQGATIFNPYRQYFKSVHYEEENISMPKSEIQNFIQTSTGDILVGSWGGGITVYDSNWDFKKNIMTNTPLYEGNLIWSFVQNDDGNIWAGCQHGFIHIYDVKTEMIRTIHPKALDSSTIWCMQKDADGNIWFGLHDGKIIEWNKQQNKYYPDADKEGDEKNLSVHVKNIFIDNHKNIWACTSEGLKKFDTKTMRFIKTYLPDVGDSSSISSKNVEAVVQYNDSILLIGTSLGGMNFFNINTEKFTRLNTSNGFPSNTLHSIKKDADGDIWFTTDYSLYKYKPADKKFTLYNIEPGVINAAFNSSQLYVLKNGNWCSSTSTEVIYFNPKILSQQNNTATPVEIAGFKIFDKPFSIDTFLSGSKPVILNYKQNFFTIEFAALDFSNVLQTKYFYKLSGVNNDWVNAGTRKSAAYTNLEPGNYIFTVKADNGNAISKETSFEIIIQPPFWKTTWFIVLCLIVVAALIYFLIQRRITTIRSKAEMKQKIAETEMIALRAQMNPHFIFNCLNSIDNLIQTNEKEKATNYLARFAKLIRAILENSKSNSIPCWKDLETLKLYLELEELRWGKKISYQLNISPEILRGDYKVPPMIIQPYVENAIHHGLLNKEGGEKKLLIDVHTEKNHIIYTIEDTGIGRKKAMEYKLLNKPTHQSMGLDITKERINLFNQNNNGSVTITDLYNEYKEAAGTRVTVSLIN